jgi:hypothetical protein
MALATPTALRWMGGFEWGDAGLAELRLLIFAGTGGGFLSGGWFGYSFMYEIELCPICDIEGDAAVGMLL